MQVTCIAAMDKNRLIGSKNDLPWDLPEDLNFFKQYTNAKTVVMGRKTFESIGRPLPNRRNVVLTRDGDWEYEGVEVIHSAADFIFWETLFMEETEICVIGGSQTYKEFSGFLDRVLISHVDGEFEGDAWLPEIEKGYYKKETIKKFDNFEVVCYSL